MFNGEEEKFEREEWRKCNVRSLSRVGRNLEVRKEIRQDLGRRSRFFFEIVLKVELC